MNKPGPPAFCICGFKKSGKTMLVEQLLRVLGEEGLRLGVIKRHSKPVQTDQPGTDTDRFYQAGADLVSCDTQSVVVRRHVKEQLSVDQSLNLLGPDYDLVLVEGFKESDLAKIWLLRPGETEPPPQLSNVVAALSWAEDRLAQALALLRPWLKQQGEKGQPLS